MIILLNFSLIFSFACKDSESLKQANELNGTWNLIRYQNGFSPIERFNADEINWKIQNTILTVTVNIDLDVSSQIPYKNSGVYELIVRDKLIIIENEEYDYSIDENSLILDQESSSGGPQIKFERI